MDARLRERIASRQALVGVVGLGYVGMPLALAFAEAGFPVLGFDVDRRKIDGLQAGRSTVPHIDDQRVGRLIDDGRLVATASLEELARPDAILICVPTPLTLQREPDLSAVVATAEAIALALRPGQLVVLESTTWPGTTVELVRPILEARGRTCGREFFLAFSPERENPGEPGQGLTSAPKVVGGADPTSGDLAESLYAAVTPRVVRVSSAAVAEAAKLTENIFRAVNIAMVNELKVIFDRMGIDVWEVIDTAATKPFGFMPFTPGPGLGGHCIPIDPFYLSWKAREHGLATRFIELAGEINLAMPGYVVAKLQQALNRRGLAVQGRRILVLGLAYKKNVADPRESPAFEILSQLLALGAEVTYHDPLIPVAPTMRSWPHLPPLESVPLRRDDLLLTDAVIVVTDHAGVDYEMVLEAAPLIIDARGVYRGPGRPPKVVPA